MNEVFLLLFVHKKKSSFLPSPNHPLAAQPILHGSTWAGMRLRGIPAIGYGTNFGEGFHHWRVMCRR